MKRILGIFFLLAWASQVQAIDKAQVQRLVGSQSAFVALDAETLTEQASVNATLPVKPASVLKIITSAAALFELGPEYRFETQAYVSDRNKNSVDRLVVKGLGDPALTTEELWKFARTVRAYGIRNIGKVLLDTSGFIERRSRSGPRAYESGASALAFNFNSIAVKVCPGAAVGSLATASVDPYEAQARLEGSVKTVRDNGNVAVELLRTKPSMVLKVSGSIGVSEECFYTYRSVEDFEHYFGTVLVELLHKEGIEVKGGFAELGNADLGQFLFAQRSKPLRLILDDLNHFSTNFIGQQVVYALGEQTASRFSFNAGLGRIIAFLESQHFNLERVKIVDGSGLSHDNRISAMLLARIIALLDRSVFGAEFRSSLPVSGLSGTLRRRDFELPSGAVRAKTGSLDGVSSLAGIVRSAKGKDKYFVVINNGLSKDQAIRVEDQLVRMLYAD